MLADKYWGLDSSSLNVGLSGFVASAKYELRGEQCGPPAMTENALDFSAREGIVVTRNICDVLL